MNSVESFREQISWSAAEKRLARKVFDQAFERQCASITAEAKKMIDSVSVPSDIWRVHDYLSQHRRTVDKLYDYRYSVLLIVFARLLRDGWLTEADLIGLQKDKIERIKIGANLYLR
jgi:hypothetical protein